MLKILFLLLVTSCVSIWGHKILMVCPPPARSHHKLCRGITDILQEHGHEVTFMSAFPKENSTYREIGVPELEKAFRASAQSGFQFGKASTAQMVKMLTEWQPLMAKTFFESESVKTFMSNKSETFDLVITEYFLNDYLLGFNVKYDCPAILLSPVALMSWTATLTGNTLSTEIVPNAFASFTDEMTLWQRTVNTFIAIIQEIMAIFVLNPTLDDLYKQYFPEEAKKVPFGELKHYIKGVFINSHPTIGVARPLFPNAFEVGGYHIDQADKVSDDLKKILDASKDGVIYFSMGSNLKSSDMTDDVKTVLLKTFASLKQTVLWKYEEDIPNKPKNVIIEKWLPQTGIFEHENVKLFISHGGFLSCTEATHYGIPMLAIPIFGDQPYNARRIEKAGQGLMLELSNVTETSLKWALNELLNNEKYKENAQHAQYLYSERPLNPRFTVAYYTDHIVRTKGAPHLQPPKLSRCSQLLLDVAAVILTPIVLGFCLLKCFCKKIIQLVKTKCCIPSSSAPNTNKDKKKTKPKMK